VLFDALAVRLVRQLLADLGQIVLTVRILDVGSEFGALAHQMTPPPQQVPGGAQLGGVDLGLGQHPAAQQHRDLVGVNLIVLGFAPVTRLPREGRAPDKGAPFLLTPVR